VSLEVFCDNEIEGRWFKSLCSAFSAGRLKKISSRGGNPIVIDNLVAYDRPDIILLCDGIPVLVIEKTREVPTGHNVGQRFARLVKSAEMQVPTIAFFPFDAMKHGDYQNICNLNIRLLAAFSKMTQIHRTPIVAVNWPVDAYHELVDDGTEDRDMAKIVGDYTRSGYSHDCSAFAAQQDLMKREYARRLKAYPAYKKPPKSVRVVNTGDFIDETRGLWTSSNASSLLKRGRSVVYTISMTPAKCRREDPYTGTQFIYDYLWCRNGPKPENKSSNLILHFPQITSKFWTKKNPNDAGRKSCNWYLTANALLFSDAAMILR